MSSSKPLCDRSDTIAAAATGGASAGSRPSPAPARPPVLEDLPGLLDRARRGEVEVLPQLREVLESRPELWRHYGDLALHAQQGWIERIGGSDLLARECLHREVTRLRQELAGP